MRVQLRLWVSLHHCRAGGRRERQVAPRLSRRQRREGAAKDVDHDLENPEVREFPPISHSTALDLPCAR
jgi:hypothetical protein